MRHYYHAASEGLRHKLVCFFQESGPQYWLTWLQVEDALASAGAQAALSSTRQGAPAAAATDAGQPLQGSAPAAQEVPSTPAVAPAPAQPAAPRKQPCHKADSAAQDSLSASFQPPDPPTLPTMLPDVPSRIVEESAANVPFKSAPAASQPPAPELQACARGEATAQEAPSAPAAASLPSLSSTPEEPVLTAAPAAPRRPKLQPGDFYITLPKPPTMATPRDDGCEDGGAGASLKNIGHPQPSPAGLADAAGAQQAAGAAVKSESSPEQGNLAPGSTAFGGHAGAGERLGNKEVLADAVSAHQAGRSLELGTASQQAGSPVPEWRQETSHRAEMDAAEAFSEQQSSSRARQAAAVARKEEAQELALEQAILVRDGSYSLSPVT